MRAIDIVASSGNNGHFVRGKVGLRHHFRTCFSSGVRVCGFQARVFGAPSLFAKRCLSVDLICGHVHKAADLAILAARFQQRVGTIGVVHCECERVTKGVVNVGLGSKVHHGINLLSFQDIAHEIRALDVALDELKVEMLLDGAEIVDGGTVIELIQHNDLQKKKTITKISTTPTGPNVMNST